MGKVKRALVVSLSAVGVVAFAWAALITYGALSRGYSWAEMDWSQDGTTSVAEFVESADIGKRSVEKDGQQCAEYFALKDGLPVKTVCPAPRRGKSGVRLD